ncbi:unnamed protein product [Phytophthora lilii]|uniref:Unnamed protein product n=1 Tax=Phytophthora lilii TaxID=2077276 RepID=A0A9W6X137_9STRA|nr:unnamed protein product [Phytophthora lilii]
MPPVRAIHARVQSDAPILVDGVFVSSFGGGELEAGYLSAMDTVNTASVEGALMSVQAEGINVNVRAEEERCERKSGMANLVSYEVLIAQTNETLAQFQDKWGKTPEYGPMLSMDGGRAPLFLAMMTFLPAAFSSTATTDSQMSARSLVPASRTTTCVLLTIDDIVGITSIENPDTGSTYANFSEWCMADSNHTEFAADAETGEMDTGLPFWEDLLNSTVNAARAEQWLPCTRKPLFQGPPKSRPPSLLSAYP